MVRVEELCDLEECLLHVLPGSPALEPEEAPSIELRRRGGAILRCLLRRDLREAPHALVAEHLGLGEAIKARDLEPQVLEAGEVAATRASLQDRLLLAKGAGLAQHVLCHLAEGSGEDLEEGVSEGHSSLRGTRLSHWNDRGYRETR